MLSAEAKLLASTALSASYPVTAKLIYAADGAPLSPSLLTAIRFSLMAGGAASLMVGGGLNSNKDDDASTTATTMTENASSGFWLAAAELGFWATAGAQCTTAALQQISVVRGTILLASVNILSPSLSAVIGTSEEQRRVPVRVWAACVLALASTVFALSDGTVTAAGMPSLQAGDEIMLGAAACYAMGQVRLSSLVQMHAAPKLAAARLQTQAACSLGFLPFALGGAGSSVGSRTELGAAVEWVSQVSATQAGLIGFSAVVAVVGLLLQYEGQQVVPAPSAQPIYAASPIISAIWAYLILREPVSSSEVLGGIGISAAALLAL